MAGHYAIDAHQHFWRYSAEEFEWIAAGSVIARDFLPEDLRPQLDAAGVAKCIAVQARQNEAETRWLLDLAAQHEWIAGVVGWLDLRSPQIGEALARYHGMPALVGLRHVIQDEPDERFMLDPRFIAGVRAAVAQGLAYDILITASQAPLVPQFLDLAGPGRFILDHGAKPAIARGEWQPWAAAIRRIAAYPFVTCKLSGFVTEADHANWKAEDFEPYLAHLLDCFGPDRLIYGSDWPVCTLAASYAQVRGLLSDFVERHCPEHRKAIFAETARAVYLDGKEGMA